jgi:ribosomal protein S3
LSLIAAILLASAYPLYYLGASYVLELRNLQLSKEERTLGSEVRKYKAILGKKKKEIKALDKRIATLQKTYHAKEKTLVAVYDKKVNYRLKSNQLAAFAEELAHFGLHVDRMMSREDGYALSILAKNDRNITELVKDVTDRYSKEIKKIDIEKIAADENSSLYHGVLKVELR